MEREIWGRRGICIRPQELIQEALLKCNTSTNTHTQIHSFILSKHSDCILVAYPEDILVMETDPIPILRSVSLVQNTTLQGSSFQPVSSLDLLLSFCICKTEVPGALYCLMEHSEGERAGRLFELKIRQFAYCLILIKIQQDNMPRRPESRDSNSFHQASS